MNSFDKSAFRFSRLTTTAVFFEFGLGLLAILGGWWWNLNLWVMPGHVRIAEWQQVIWGVVLTIPLLSLLLLERSSWQWVERLRTVMERDIVPRFVRLSHFELALIAAAAGFGEELLFRGFLQQLAVQSCGVWIGIGLVSLMFGAVHAISKEYIWVATAMGVYFGLIHAYFGHTWIVVVVHAAYDWVALVYLVRRHIAAARINQD
ncbi:MAG: CPBP family intramembrane metalloprotease [Planctomycetales bacterium]|nr:CPBP family intramembrane metalloprotease [Planctomycetales bacterium]